VVVNGDPSAHAEMEAIRDACSRLGTRDLRGCIMYSTTAACAMCETAAYWANVKHMYAGSGITDQGAPRYGGC
jgi:tRNA(Arg) A34 adenosine deaminase TadA